MKTWKKGVGDRIFDMGAFLDVGPTDLYDHYIAYKKIFRDMFILKKSVAMVDQLYRRVLMGFLSAIGDKWS